MSAAKKPDVHLTSSKKGQVDIVAGPRFILALDPDGYLKPTLVPEADALKAGLVKPDPKAVSYRVWRGK